MLPTTEKAKGRSSGCPVELPVRVLGGKWKLLLVFHLLDGPRRNGELRRLVPGITQKMLTQQLRELERDGLVVRIVHQQVPPKVVYELAPGEVEHVAPLLKALSEWACHWAERTGAQIPEGECPSECCVLPPQDSR